MSGYVCTKACNLGGVVYNRGDAIPSEAVLPSREKALIAQGFIARSESIENLTAENQALKARIEELEAQIAGAAQGQTEQAVEQKQDPAGVSPADEVMPKETASSQQNNKKRG